MSLFTPTRAALAAALSLTTLAASAAEWRDFSLAYTYGTRFKEPYVADGGNIAKNIVTARYVDGDSWGGNFFNADVMKSGAVDNKATEVFVMYRRLFDFGKISQRDLSFGPVKSVGATVGFDWNTKNSPEYGSRTRTLVAGPTLVMDVPEGFLNVSVLAIWESNRPTAANLPERYWYKTHPALDLSWGIPLGNSHWQFGGYGQYIAAKGQNEFGGPTSPETHINANLMYDLGPKLGLRQGQLKAGFGYDYWRAKFGNPASVPGAVARTPYLSAEYHF